MTIVASLTWLLALGAGALTGLLFFGGLWLTVTSLGRARHPALTMAGSLVARLAMACGVFYAIACLGSGLHLLAAVAGFLLPRLVMAHRLNRAAGPPGAGREIDG